MSAQPMQQIPQMGAQYCSYRVGGPLDEPYLPKTQAEAVSILKATCHSQRPLTVLGGGSNTIIASRGIRGVTFIAKRLMFVEPVGPKTFQVGAGMPLAKVCKLAQDHALSGVEFMIGVPGTVGGAVAMNAGAMGQETADTLDFALLFNLETGSLEQWSREQLHFAYRTSAIRPDHMVLIGAQFTWTPGDPDTIAARIQDSLAFRQQHHPKDPNGGSVFQNPAPDQPAGRILDEAGAKGWREGGAMVSPMHANFIVNVDHATSTDILRLMLRMKRTLQDRTGLPAHPENRFVGEATEEERTIWKELTGHELPH